MTDYRNSVTRIERNAPGNQVAVVQIARWRGGDLPQCTPDVADGSCVTSNAGPNGVAQLYER